MRLSIDNNQVSYSGRFSYSFRFVFAVVAMAGLLGLSACVDNDVTDLQNQFAQMDGAESRAAELRAGAAAINKQRLLNNGTLINKQATQQGNKQANQSVGEPLTANPAKDRNYLNALQAIRFEQDPFAGPVSAPVVAPVMTDELLKGPVEIKRPVVKDIQRRTAPINNVPIARIEWVYFYSENTLSQSADQSDKKAVLKLPNQTFVHVQVGDRIGTEDARVVKIDELGLLAFEYDRIEQAIQAGYVDNTGDAEEVVQRKWRLGNNGVERLR